jgi:hypothetical protein
MALITGLVGILGRFAGRLLNSSLGWATVLLFGKVAGRKQPVLLGIALGALLWVALLIGIVFPDLGTALIAVVPAPAFVSRDLIRLAMLAGAIVVPLLIGVGALFVTEAERRPRGPALVGGLLRGYPFALLLALTMVLLAAVAIVRKIQSLVRRWEDAHVAVIIKPGRYDEVLGDLEHVLRRGGVPVVRRAAPGVLAAPPRILARVAGTGLGGLVPDRLVVLAAPGLEALVYPSDISIAGTKDLVARSRALIAAQLTSAPAYMTTSAEAERLEDELRGIAELGPGLPRVALDRLDAVDRELMRLTVPFDEWETVYRERLQLERDILAGKPPAQLPAALPMGARVASPSPRPSLLERAFAIGSMALLLLDVALLAGRGRGPRPARGGPSPGRPARSRWRRRRRS